MLKRIYFIAAIIISIALLVSCAADTETARTNGDAVRLTVRGGLDATRTVYDAGLSRAVWTDGDAIFGAAYMPDGDIVGGFSEFNLVKPYKPTNAAFTGALAGVEGRGEFDMFFIYSGKGFDAGSCTCAIPAVQKPTLASFDGEGAVMFGKPFTMELGTTADAEEVAVRFRHAAGFLKLSLAGIPEAMLSKTVTGVSVEGGDDDIMAGGFRVDITNTAGKKDYALVPVSPSNSITLDYSASAMTLAELTDCWFVMNPGSYASLNFKISLDGGEINYAPRTGLQIAAGTIVAQQITFRDGDEAIAPVSDVRTFTISGADIYDLLTPDYDQKSSGTYTVTDSSGKEIEIVYSDLEQWSKIDRYPFMDGVSCVRVETPLEGAITSIEVECPPNYSKNFMVTFMSAGASEWPDTRLPGAANTAVNVFTPPADGESYTRFMFTPKTGYITGFTSATVTYEVSE